MKDDFVEGSGWISDESSDFCGNKKTQTRLEKRTKRGMKRQAQESPSPHTTSKKINGGLEHRAPPEAMPEPQQTSDVLAFLKSRPQIAALSKAAASGYESPEKGSTHTTGNEEAADVFDNEGSKGDMSVWQQSETVDAFLKRAPVTDPATAALGPWLWVRNPKIISSQRKHQANTDVRSFTKGGEKLLEDFDMVRAKIESSKPEAPPSTITRHLRPHREQLEDNLLSLAVKTSTTCGKWMLFPYPDDYPRYWRLVAEATAKGKLGVTSKAATFDPTQRTGLICVYSYDFTDTEDVRRILEELVDLGVCRAESSSIHYKCDAYTYLDLYTNNVYKIKPSLYSSQEILKNEVKGKQDGPIARLKKGNNTIDSFFA